MGLEQENEKHRAASVGQAKKIDTADSILSFVAPPSQTFMHATDPLFELDHASPDIKAKINTGYMECCVRRGHDFSEYRYELKILSNADRGFNLLHCW
jgi:hypothetical protein